jgi:chemotaxis protein MotB
VKNQRFPSNWELSAARAGSVVRFLVSHGLNENSMRAIGYGNTKPVSQELHANRRVVISIRKERRDE